MMDTLRLKGMQFRAFHGYYEEERDKGNDFEVDLTFRADLRDAANNDDLNLTIDYQQAENIVRDVMDGHSVELIETLANRIGEKLFKSFPMVQQLDVQVRKMGPPLDTETHYSEVSMSWQR